MGRRVAGGIAALLGVVISVLVATATPAWAHNELRSSDPAGGASLDVAPAAVVLTFAEPLIAGQTTVTVIGPNGADAVAGPAQLSGPTATVAFKPSTAGAYTVGYRVVADDGDVTEATLIFTLTAAAVPAAAAATTAAGLTGPAAAPGSDSSNLWWVWVLVAVVVIGGAVLVVLLRRRRAGQSASPGR